MLCLRSRAFRRIHKLTNNKMKISKQNWFARYYNWLNGELPNDICSFFWGSVLIIGLFPMLVPGRLVVNYRSKSDYFGISFFLWMAYLMLLVVGAKMTDSLGYEFTHWTGFIF